MAPQADDFRSFLEKVPQAANEAQVRELFAILAARAFSDTSFARDMALAAEHAGNFKNNGLIRRGRIDSFLDNVLVEFKLGLVDDLADAEDQLREYLAGAWREDGSYRRSYTAVATDGLNWRVYAARPRDSRVPSEKENVELVPSDRYAASSAEAPDRLRWFLNRLFFRKTLLPPTVENIVSDFGVNSAAFLTVAQRLADHLVEVGSDSQTQLYIRDWKKDLQVAYGEFSLASNDLFVRHTYLAVLARLLVWTTFERRHASLADLQSVYDGAYFTGKGVGNFVEDDYFRWHRLEGHAGLAEAWQALVGQLATYDLGAVEADILKPLYEALVDPEMRHDLGEYYTPNWLSARVVDDLVAQWSVEKRGIPAILDPACGSGSFLRASIWSLRNGPLGAESAEKQLSAIVASVQGIDVHPLAVIVSKATYLLAISDLINPAVPGFHLPVYMANSLAARLYRQFDLIVGNPPWLTFSGIAEGDYRTLLLNLNAELEVALRGPGQQAHTEIATIFMLHVWAHFLRPLDEADPPPQLAFVMPRSVFNASHHEHFRRGSHTARCDVAEVWDLDGVGPLFNVPACVLLLSAGFPRPAHPKAGRRAFGQLRVRDPEIADAAGRISWQQVKFSLGQLGRRSAWRVLEDGAVADPEVIAAHKPGPYVKAFRQGAILYPQTLLVVQIPPSATPASGDITVATHEGAAASARLLPTLRWTRVVEAAVIHQTYAAEHLLPFAVKPEAWHIVLPVKARPSDAGFRAHNPDDLRAAGLIHVADWLEMAEQEWETVRKPSEQKPLWQRIDHLRQLSGQAGMKRYVTVYTASGSRTVAAVLDTRKCTFPYVARDKTYWMSTDDENEAHYLSAFLNSGYVAGRIQAFMTRGLMGPRDTHKRVLDVPWPSYDPADPLHGELVGIAGKLAAQAAARAAAMAANPAAGTGKARGQVRQALTASKLTRLDELVRLISDSAAA